MRLSLKHRDGELTGGQIVRREGKKDKTIVTLSLQTRTRTEYYLSHPTEGKKKNYFMNNQFKKILLYFTAQQSQHIFQHSLAPPASTHPHGAQEITEKDNDGARNKKETSKKQDSAHKQAKRENESCLRF